MVQGRSVKEEGAPRTALRRKREGVRVQRAGHVNNSRAIQKRHPVIYRNFFASCHLAVSAPAKFFWAGEYAAHIGAPLVGQNLPLRIYVGLERMKQKGRIDIVDSMYVPSEDRFRSQMDQVHRIKLTKYLIEFATHSTGKGDFPGLRVHSVSEAPSGSGLGVSGSFSAALALAMLMEFGEVSQCDVASWSRITTHLLPQNRSFDKTFRLAWKLSTILHDGISSGGAAFMSFIGSLYPIVYFSESRTGLATASMATRVPLMIRGNYDLIDRLHYGGMKFNRLFGFREQPSWPVAFHLVYSGEKGGGRKLKSVREIDDALFAVSGMVLKYFKVFRKDPDAFTPLFYDLARSEGGEGLHRKYLNSLYVIALEVLQGLKDVFDEGASEQSVQRFLHAINDHYEALRILNRSTPLMDRITRYLGTRMEERLGAKSFAMKLTGAGRGGDFLVVSTEASALVVLEEEIDMLRRETYENIWLDYSSLRDGLEERGIVIEQNLSDNVYSPYVSEGSIVLTHYAKQGKTQMMLTAEQLEKKRSSFPLLLDATVNTVSVKGRRLTSKDIKSAKTTIAILRILLESTGEQISKERLPSSSYTADRNEIQSKIFSPLNAALREILNRPLPVSVEGGIRNYSVKLSSLPFAVYVLERRL